MYSYLSGKLIEKNPTNIIIEVNGIGYLVNISLHTFELLPEINSDVKIFTLLIPREDSIQLYGFASTEEKFMFEQLLTISGIGPKVAQSILSGISPEELLNYIVQGNSAALTRIPGIGKKTAERMVVELKDKLQKISTQLSTVSTNNEEIRYQAYQALITLGYQKQMAEKALRVALNELNGNDLTLENLLKRALKELNS